VLFIAKLWYFVTQTFQVAEGLLPAEPAFLNPGAVEVIVVITLFSKSIKLVCLLLFR